MNKNVLITGVSGGIGRAAALSLSEKGYNIIGIYNKDKASADLLSEELLKNNRAFRFYQVDLSSFAETEKAVGNIIEENGSIDVLVNCAGVSLIRQIQDVSEEEFDFVNAVNYKSVFNISRLVIPGMIGRQRGRIINISSMWGNVGASCEAVYSASKAAVIGFSKALARELAPSNIQVNCVCPGVIDTKMNAFLSVDEAAELKESIPMERFGNPGEVADLIAYLACEAPSYLTAQVITIDGALT